MPRSPISSSARPSIDFRVPVLSRTTRCYGPTGRGTRMSSTSTRTSFFFSFDPVRARNHESNTTVHRLNVSVLLYFFNYARHRPRSSFLSNRSRFMAETELCFVGFLKTFLFLRHRVSIVTCNRPSLIRTRGVQFLRYLADFPRAKIYLSLSTLFQRSTPYFEC